MSNKKVDNKVGEFIVSTRELIKNEYGLDDVVYECDEDFVGFLGFDVDGEIVYSYDIATRKEGYADGIPIDAGVGEEFDLYDVESVVDKMIENYKKELYKKIVDKIKHDI